MMNKIVAVSLFVLALALATYGVTRHRVALRIQMQNESAFQEFVRAEARMRNPERVSEGMEAAAFTFPDHFRELQLRLGMPDGIYTFLDGMILCLAGAAVLAATACFMGQRKRDQKTAGPR